MLKSAASNSTQFYRYHFYLYILLAIVVNQIPWLSLPLNWLEAYFHEISHGISALLTGGEIVQIQLFTNGSGLCTTRGGSAFFISIAGYIGAVMWGMFLYKMPSFHQRMTYVVAAFMAILISLSVILWVRDLLTVIICLFLIALFVFTLKFNKYKQLQYCLQFFGIVVLLNGLQSPLYLIDGRPFGDGAALAELTFIPEIFWVLLWSIIGLAALFWLGKNNEELVKSNNHS